MKKLNLKINKETIANLNSQELNSVKGEGKRSIEIECISCWCAPTFFCSDHYCY
ncbi:MAG: class I lanthipeptide [Hyphomicrobiales bacterium]